MKYPEIEREPLKELAQARELIKLGFEKESLVYELAAIARILALQAEIEARKMRHEYIQRQAAWLREHPRTQEAQEE